MGDIWAKEDVEHFGSSEHLSDRSVIHPVGAPSYVLDTRGLAGSHEALRQENARLLKLLDEARPFVGAFAVLIGEADGEGSRALALHGEIARAFQGEAKAGCLAPRRSELTERQRRGFSRVLFILASSTSSRWDQHLRYEIGDEDADAVIAWLAREGIPGDFGSERSSAIIAGTTVISDGPGGTGTLIHLADNVREALNLPKSERGKDPR
jgi:hypothetical protein